MYEAMMIAATGLKNQQRRVDTIADNIANIQTVGFKASRLDFKDALYTAGIVPGPPYTPDGNQQKGHGVMVAAITKNFSSGSITTTGNMLDFAVLGDNFLEVMDPSGQLRYTKSGNLYASTGANGTFLVNAQGYFVMNDRGNRISVPRDTTNIEVSEQGDILFTIGDGERTEMNRLGVYMFPNKNGLSSVGNSNYEITAASGNKQPSNDVLVRQGALETSNVDLAYEMTRLIRSQRAFSLASRALTTADDMEGIANNLRK